MRELARMKMRKISLLVLVVSTAAMIGCGDDDNGENGDNGNDGNNGEEFGETYDDLQGVWVSDDVESDGFEQQIIREIDGAEAVQEAVDLNTGETLFEAVYHYEVGDEVQSELAGETVTAREIDLKVIEYREGAHPDAEEGGIYYDIFKITELDGETVAYFSNVNEEDEENRPDTLYELVYTRQ